MLNFNRMSVTTSSPVRAIICWNYYSTVFHGVALPCGWPGWWHTAIFSGIKFLQVNDTYGHIYGMEGICENINPGNLSGYCSWYY